MGCAGPARRASRSLCPKPPLLRNFTKERGRSKSKARAKSKPSDDDSVATTRGLLADAFFGASPVVASALGSRPGRDPEAAVRTYHEGAGPALKTGTFYLAGKRNFLFGSDIGNQFEYRRATG